MSWMRICVGASLCIALSGCGLILGEAPDLVVEMHRVSDGAKVTCLSGIYNPVLGEAGARRTLSACVLACRRRGFVENGDAIQIGESVLRPEDGGNTPAICQG